MVDEFARVANFLNFVYCYSIITQNQRSALGSTDNDTRRSHGAAGGPARSNPDRTALVAYFPFDPYKLKRSQKWVEGYYVDWEAIPGLDPEDSDDEEDEEDDDEEEDDSDSEADSDDNEKAREDDSDDEDAEEVEEVEEVEK